MKIINTSDVPDSLIEEVVKFVKPDDVNGVKIFVDSGLGYSRSWIDEKKIEVKIPKPNQLKYPMIHHPKNKSRWASYKYYSYDGENYCYSEIINYVDNLRLPILTLSRTELLVYIMAHELRHQWQRRRPLRSQWTYGNRGKNTKQSREHDACQYAMMKLRQWRKLNNRNDAIYLSPFISTGIEQDYPKTQEKKMLTTVIFKAQPDKEDYWIKMWEA